MKIWHSMIAAAVLFSTFTFAQEYSPPIETHIVNGIQVHLINTREGNAFTLATLVLGGSLYDEPTKHAGLAHLWEHFIHAGSTKFPGAKTFNNMAQAIGGRTNASTSSKRVYYFFNSHPDAFEEAAQLQGAMISSPEWSEETFIGERAIVMNEAQEYMADDTLALSSILRLELFPQNHPMRMYDVGTQAQLSAMTTDDLRGLFQRAYTPKSMHLLVAANFEPLPGKNTPTLDRARVLDAISRHYFPQATNPNLTAPNEQVFPDITDKAPVARWIEVGTPSQAIALSIEFQIPQQLAMANPEALEVAVDFLNLEGPGTLHHALLSAGMITSFGVGVENLNNLHLLTISAGLTEQGAVKRQDVMALILNALGKLKADGLSPAVVHMLIQRNLALYGKTIGHADAMAKIVVAELTRSANPKRLANAFNFRERFSKVTSDSVKQIYQATFNLSQMLGGYVGPDVVSSDRQREFDRPIRRLNADAQTRLTQEWSQHLSDTKAMNDLGRLPTARHFSGQPLPLDGTAKAPEVIQPIEGVRVIHEELRTSENSALVLRWDIAPTTPKMAAALELFEIAANQHFAPEWIQLQQFGVMVSLSVGPMSIAIRLQGPGHLLQDIGSYYWEQVRNHFVVNEADVSFAQAAALNASMDSENDFSAMLAVESLRTLLTKGGSHRRTLQKLGSKLTAAEVQTFWKSVFAEGADITVSGVGAIGRQSLLNWAMEHRAKLSSTLSAKQRELRRNSSYLAGEESVTFWSRLHPIKDTEAFGIVRAYHMPFVDLQQNAASLVLSEMLSHQIGNLNRVERNLGYIHSASRRLLLGGQIRISFAGQTEKADNFPRVAEGWQEILDRWNAGAISEEEFQSTVRGIKRSIRIIAVGRNERMNALTGLTDLNLPLTSNDDLLIALDSLTLAEVIALAKTHLVGAPYVQVVASRVKPNCEGMFVGMHAARAKLREI